MKKHFLKSTFVSAVSCVGLITPIINLSSCKSKDESVPTITLSSTNFTVDQRQFTIPAYFNFVPQGEVHVELISVDSRIHLENDTVVVEDGQANLNFVIDESVIGSQPFNVDLHFSCIDEQSQEQSLYIYDILIAYNGQEIIERDLVWLDSYYSFADGIHSVIFKCNFPQKPVSPTISVFINNKSSNLFKLGPEDHAECQIVNRKIEIKLELDISVFKKTTYSFDMNMSFTNSYGKLQEESFPHCAFTYDMSKTGEVPLDYLDLQPINASQYRLAGLKEGVSPLEGGKYSILNIPENVVEIDPNAFGKEFDIAWFCNLKKIRIPATVKTIGERAFYGCNNLTEFDFSAYQDAIPPWAKTTNLFNSQTFNTVGGFVWAGKQNDLDVVKQNLVGWGLPSAWSPYNDDMVNSDSDFTIGGDKHDVIEGLNEETKENFKHYKVIRIPDNVARINEKVFDYLKENPYESPSSTPEHPIYETRELILGYNFDNFSGGNFENGGFSGNILFYCTNLESIDSRAFSNMQNYGWPGIKNVTSKPIQLIFDDCFGLTGIGQYAFNYVPVENKILDLKQSIQSISSFAFQGNHIEQIIFHKNITSVGLDAFANVYFEPSTPRLKYIDLSCYNEKLIDPESQEETYIPEWFKKRDLAFAGSCVDNGTVHLYPKAIDEIKKSTEGWDKWTKNFKDNHGIPQNWKIV